MSHLTFLQRLEKRVLLGYGVWFISMSLLFLYLILEPHMESVRFIPEDVQFVLYRGWVIFCGLLSVAHLFIYRDCWVLDIFLVPLSGYYLFYMWLLGPMMIYRSFP